MIYIYCNANDQDKEVIKNEDAIIVTKGSLKKGEIVRIEIPDSISGLEKVEMAQHEFEMKLRELSSTELAENFITTLKAFCDAT